MDSREEHQARLRQEVDRGRRMQVAREVLQEYLDQERKRILSALESASPQDSQAVLADWQAFRRFEKRLDAAIGGGKNAEKELSEVG